MHAPGAEGAPGTAGAQGTAGGENADSARRRGRGRVVLLAGPGVSTSIVYHHLAARFPGVAVVMERPVDRLTLARRRARRIGWVTVVGQVAFITVAMPILAYRARSRVRTIVTEAGMNVQDITDVTLVPSVNDPGTVDLLRRLAPDVVVVNGTRIISRSVLESVACPFVNLHMGITPSYRGVHGGYWALAEGRPDLVGTTVHIVDAGIDTGTVLAQERFTVTPRDSIATYPYLHLAYGLPALAEHVDGILAGRDVPEGDLGAADAGPSRLRWHPTLWGYLWKRLTRGAR
jgi:folate-dependent phosphoribosylglycinamide formyltransferase PurN